MGKHPKRLLVLVEELKQRVDVLLRAAIQNEGELSAADKIIGQLRARIEELELRHTICAQCQCALLEPDEPPYCEGCAVDEEHLEEWEKALEKVAPKKEEAHG